MKMSYFALTNLFAGITRAAVVVHGLPLLRGPADLVPVILLDGRKIYQRDANS